ncbi:MAG: recombinase family protein, partial [Pseudobdellovibrionaceae bacterium]|nr:recombinase family protein [Pseudobdellovibrionaceae bacterium]
MEWCWRTETRRDAVAIKRVSSHKQGDGVSPSVQEEEIRKYCAERNLKIVKIVNLEESAKVSGNRSEYAHALKNILKSQIHHIVYYASDRESRNMTDLETTNELIRSGKIAVHHVNDRKVYWKGSTSNDYFIRYILGARNANFSDNLSERVIDALTTKSKLGWYPHARPPLGYIGRRHMNEYGKESARGLSIVVPDPNEDAVSLVKREFELRALGYGYKEIRRRIISEGWKIPRSVKNYTSKSIEYRLKCKFYYGYFSYRGIEYKGNHELIIPQEILRKVKRSFEHGDFYKAKHEKDAIFGGWIRC